MGLGAWLGLPRKPSAPPGPVSGGPTGELPPVPKVPLLGKLLPQA